METERQREKKRERRRQTHNTYKEKEKERKRERCSVPVLAGDNAADSKIMLIRSDQILVYN